jgi:hypothetical protein
MQEPSDGHIVERNPDQLIFRFYQSDRSARVDSRGMDIRHTPHYKLALAVLRGEVRNPNHPALRMYNTHCVYEHVCGCGALRSIQTFLANINEWNRNIDNIGGYIEIVQDPSGYEYITDGAHRAAFLTAYNDIHREQRRIRCYIRGQFHWPRLRGLVDDIPLDNDELRRRLREEGEKSHRTYPTGLFSGQSLEPGQRILSPNSKHILTYQSDGNLCIYSLSKKNNWVCTWATMTNGTKPGQVRMQVDGNFVVYTQQREAIRATATYKFPDSRIEMQDDGNLVIYDVKNQPLWDSKSYQMQKKESPHSRILAEEFPARDLNAGPEKRRDSITVEEPHNHNHKITQHRDGSFSVFRGRHEFSHEEAQDFGKKNFKNWRAHQVEDSPEILAREVLAHDAKHHLHDEKEEQNKKPQKRKNSITVEEPLNGNHKITQHRNGFFSVSKGGQKLSHDEAQEFGKEYFKSWQRAAR